MIKPDPSTVDYDINLLVSLAPDERLYVGIDVGKESHHAGFVSKSLLAKHKRFDRCPVTAFANSREGFEKLLEAVKVYVPLDRCIVLKERTGHYGHALQEYLQGQGLTCYTMQIFKRMLKNKTDKRDALNLANTLYAQLELGLSPGDAIKQIRHELPATATAKKLQVLVRRQAEIGKDITVRRNRLTAIADELFPELTQDFKDPNGVGALKIRERFPTPADIVTASMDELLDCRAGTRPSRNALLNLQELAKQSVGIKNSNRLYGLVLEQGQLLAELRLMQSHIAILESEIATIVEESREGQILMSTGFIGTLGAAGIIASIGNIAKFESPGKLRAYGGWSPRATQTGTTKDAMTLARGGNKILKRSIFFIAWNAIKGDTELKAKYDRLVPRKCNFDARTGKYTGKMKCVARIAGDVCTLIYVLLRRDHDLLAALPADAKLPDPLLYSRETHKKAMGIIELEKSSILAVKCPTCDEMISAHEYNEHVCASGELSCPDRTPLASQLD